VKHIVKHKLALIILMLIIFLIKTADSKIIRITMITWRGETDAERGFKEGMRRLGYTVKYTHLDAGQDKKRLQEIINKIPQTSPDIIYTFGTTVTTAVVKQFKNIPIIFVIVTQPVRSGIVKSMKGSGTNVAGVTHGIPVKSNLKAIGKIIKKLKKLGLIFNPNEKNSIIIRDTLRLLAAKKNFILIESPVYRKDDIKMAAYKIIKAKVDIVYLPSDSLVVSNAAEVVEYFNQHKIPTLGTLEAYVTKNNALIGLIIRYYEVGRLAAIICDKILKGENPGDIPIKRPKVRYVVNLRTAKRIGVKIPIGIISIASRVIK